MIRVFVVEDSPVMRTLLVHILSSDPQMEVIGTAENGEEALRAVQLLSPDIITMDINMPRIDGFEVTRRIMATHPVPIVIVTGSYDRGNVEVSFQALKAGALMVLQKPEGLAYPGHQRNWDELIDAVKLMAQVKVVRRWATPEEGRSGYDDALGSSTQTLPSGQAIYMVAIGASTGGPPVIQDLLSRIPRTFSAPVLIVQHMAPGFTQGFVDWLSQTSALPVHLGLNGGKALRGHAYVAPDNFHMKVNTRGELFLSEDDPENGCRPSVSYLFRHVMQAYGRNAAGVLLTGMGKDGALELGMMREKGAITIAQDEESSVIFGMPGEAVRLNAAQYVLSPEKIIDALVRLTTVKLEVPR